jgi:uncharacterized RDD family membrane protein YckC
MTMKPRDTQLEEPALFDLPLHDAHDANDVEPKRAAAKRRPGEVPMPQALSLFPEESAAVAAVKPPEVKAPVEPARPGPRPVPPPAPRERIGLLQRLLAGLADFAVHLAVGVLLVAGSRALGVERTPPWPPIALCLLLFSFVYFVVPLAFWGNTPGMAWRGLQARSRGGEPLAFGQATRRWLGAIVTALLAGVPALGALRGRSFTDLVSGSALRRDR